MQKKVRWIWGITVVVVSMLAGCEFNGYTAAEDQEQELRDGLVLVPKDGAGRQKSLTTQGPIGGLSKAAGSPVDGTQDTGIARNIL